MSAIGRARVFSVPVAIVARFVKRDLAGKPASTFADHALDSGSVGEVAEWLKAAVC
jgi:hypothetical protein